jgi:hypothetical protein
MAGYNPERKPVVITERCFEMLDEAVKKFRYNIFYRELDSFTSIRGIWHTSRGTDFED